MDQNGPFVHFGLKRSILVHLGPPTVLWPFLTNAVEPHLSPTHFGSLQTGLMLTLSCSEGFQEA